MSEEELNWYESEEGIRQFVENCSSENIVRMNKHFKSISKRLDLIIGDIQLVLDFNGNLCGSMFSARKQ